MQRTPGTVLVRKSALEGAGPRPPTADERAAMFGVDGDTITIMLLIAIVGMGAEGDVLVLTQTPYVDNLLAHGWVVLYSGPTPPTALYQWLNSGPMTLSTAEQADVLTYLGITSGGLVVPLPTTFVPNAQLSSGATSGSPLVWQTSSAIVAKALGYTIAADYNWKTSNSAAANDTALTSATTAAGTGGTVWLGPGAYQIAAWHVFNNCDILGSGGGSTSQAGATTLTCTASAAGIELQGGGSRSGGFRIDGNHASSTVFKRSGGTGANARRIENVIGLNNLPASNTNDLALFYAAQNDTVVGCGFGGADRDAVVFDQGYGGALFERLEINTAGRYHMRFDNASTIVGQQYPYPTNNVFIQGICEGLGGTSVIKMNAGAQNTFISQQLFTANAITGPFVDIAAGVLRTRFTDPTMQVVAAPGVVAGSTAWKITGASSLIITGASWYFNFDTIMAVDTIAPKIIDQSWAQYFSCTTPAPHNTFTNAATLFQIQSIAAGLPSRYANSTDIIEIVYNLAGTAILSERRADGALLFFSGAGFGAFDAAFLRRKAGAVGVPFNTQQLLVTGSGNSAARPAADANTIGGLYANSDTGLVEVQQTATLWSAPAVSGFPSYAPQTPSLKNRYDPRNHSYNAKGSNRRKWRAGLGRAAGGGNSTYIIASDSSGAGCNQAILSPFTFDRRNAWPISMAKEWARHGTPVGGTGLIRCVDGPSASDSRWSSSGTVSNSSAFVNLAANGASVTCTLSAADFYSIATYTFVTIWYLDVGTGTWTASVNGASSGVGFASVTNTNSGVWKPLVLPGVAVVAGSTLAITRSTSAVNQSFAGANFWTPNAGAIVHNVSQSGATATGTGFAAWGDMSSTGLGGVYKDLGGHARSVADAVFSVGSTTAQSATAAFVKGVDEGQPLSHSAASIMFPDNTYIVSVTDATHAVMSNPASATGSGQILIIGREPDGVVIALGGNDLPTATGAAVCTAYNTIKGTWANSDVMYVGEHQKNDVLIPAATWEAYLGLLYTQADLDDVPLFDLRAKIGNYATALANGIMGDNAAHLVVGSYIEEGRLIANSFIT